MFKFLTGLFAGFTGGFMFCMLGYAHNDLCYDIINKFRDEERDEMYRNGRLN